MTKYLYGASIQGIQSFIFQTNKLKDIVGASLLVEDACTELFNEFIRDEESVEKIINAAGNIKCVFYNEDDCRRVVFSFPKRVMEMAPGITISQAVVHLDEESEINHSERRKKALEDLEELLHAQRNRQSKSLLYGCMAMERSCKTGLPACKYDSKSKDYLDEGQLAKDMHLSSKKESNLYKKLYGGEPMQIWPTKDVENMTRDNDWLAIIHADGNGLGEVVADIGENGKLGGNEKTLSKFSKELDDATKKAAQEACKEVNGKEGEDLWIRPVVIGGDDLTVICRADLAIPFMRKYLEVFEEETKGIGHLSACAGIAFIKSSYPFYYGYDLAEALCGQAKKDAKSPEMKSANDGKIPSCLMFHKVQSSFVEDYNTIKAKELTPCEGHSFCFGPYYLKEQKDRWTIDELLEKADGLDGEDNNRVKTAIREWMTLLSEGEGKAGQKEKRVEALYEGEKKTLFEASVGTVERDGVKCHPAYDILALFTINTQKTK